ncbi:MAG TPA: hypothetical protein VJS12_04525 [Steroidobacteraceae bacterium]|nr:hypothetical protein [Steroidobacteraceae bacterium]
MRTDAAIAAFVRVAAVAFALLSLTGCNQEEMLQKFASPEDQATARKYIDALRAGRYEEIEAVADPAIQGPTLRPTLEQMAALMPDEEPSSVKLVGAQTQKGPQGTAKNLTFKYWYGEKWLLVNVATQSKGGVLTIVGFNVYPEAQAATERNRFQLAGKTPLHYLVLALTVFAPLFSLYTLIQCARTKIASKKWLWIVLILIGVGKFEFNWTTGDWAVSTLYVQLLSASVITDAQGAMILAVSVPLGAILFLLRRQLPIRQDDEA